jgi:putative ABC transport system permease protein
VTTDGLFVDVPWALLAAVVLALPLVAAAVVGAASRSRLPLVARLN